MGQWLTMKILGFLKDPLFYLRILATCSVLSTGLLIRSQVNNTLDANTSGKKENLKVEREGSQANQTGSDIMEALTILNEILEKLEKTLSDEKSSPFTQPLEK